MVRRGLRESPPAHARGDSLYTWQQGVSGSRRNCVTGRGRFDGVGSIGD
jgi:hypothetical protein